MDQPTNTAPPTALLAPLARCLPALLARQGWLLCVKDAGNGRIQYVNSAMAAFLGRDAHHLVGLTDADLFDAATAAALRAADKTALAQGEPLCSEHQFDWQGQRVDFEVTRFRMSAAAGGPELLGAVWVDRAPDRRREAQLADALRQIEQQHRAQVQLEGQLAELAQPGRGNGSASRAHFDEQMRRELDLSSREHREFALVDIEIDALALPAGVDAALAVEQVLETMSRLLRGGTRAMDASARLEGRRFLVLLSGVGLATAHSRMESLRRQCATQIVAVAGREVRFTTSMGVASYPHTAGDGEQLLAASAAALAEARRRGGNQVTLASIRFEGV